MKSSVSNKNANIIPTTLIFVCLVFFSQIGLCQIKYNKTSKKFKKLIIGYFNYMIVVWSADKRVACTTEAPSGHPLL